MRIGPVMLNPAIALTNLGVDDNVFNEAENQNPKEDFTFTVTPASDVWLRVGPTWYTANIGEDLVSYQKYSSERAANTFDKGAWTVPLPYYLLIGIDLAITQQVFGPFDVVGRLGWQKLAYRDRAAAPVTVSDRIDYVHSHGGGVGYHLGPYFPAWLQHRSQ
jgi:hypothetical protein